MPVYRIYRVGSPYNSSELDALDYEQTADVLYMAHKNHKPGKWVRANHADWTFSDVSFGPLIATPTSPSVIATQPNTDSANKSDGYFPQSASYVVTAYDEVTGQESRPTAQVNTINDLALKRNYNTISWTAVTGATGYRVYKADNTNIFGYIGTTASASFRDDNIGADQSEGPPVGDNPFNLAGDYPAKITFHEQRSYWAQTINRPNAIYASRSADYENMDFTRPGVASDAFVVGLVANKVNSVEQLHSFKQGLLALTSHNIFTVQGSNQDYITAIPPPRIRPEVKRGASGLQPISIDSVVFYKTAKGSEIRALNYNFDVDGIKSNDMTIFSRHLFEKLDIVAWDYAETPGSTIKAVRSDGKLLIMTWDEAQEVWGWTLCETDGLFKGVAVVFEYGEDRAYYLIERVINGVTKLYVEREASEQWVSQNDACYLDCARTFSSDTKLATFDRLDHLEGKTVIAWVDGAKVSTSPSGGPLVVSQGAVTLATAGLTITIGLPFTARIKTMPLAIQTQQGWSVAAPQEVEQAVIRVVNTRNIKVGVRTGSLFDVKQRDPSDNYNSEALFTGDLHPSIEGNSGDEASLIVESSDPTPMHITAIMIQPGFGDIP